MNSLARMLHGRVHYAWVVAGVVFVLLLCSAGVRSTPGVLIIPLEKSLGWDRTTISSAVALNLFLFGLMGPFAGAAMLRFSPVTPRARSLPVFTCGSEDTVEVNISDTWPPKKLHTPRKTVRTVK